MLLHVGFVLECKLAASAVAMKVSCFLPTKRAIMSGAVFTPSKSEKKEFKGSKSKALYAMTLDFVNFTLKSPLVG